MISWSLILIAMVIGLTIYRYLIRSLRYFENSGIPYLKPKILFGNMGNVVFKKRSMPDHVKWLYESYPEAKYFGFHDFTVPTIIIRDPELIKHVTIKCFDNFVNHTIFADENIDPFFGKNLFGLRNDRWREMRLILSPAFTSSKMKGMFQSVSNCGVKFADHLASGSNEIELKDYFTRYTMDVIATAAFGVTLDSLKDPENEFYRMGREATTLNYVKTLKIFLFKVAPTLVRLFHLRMVTKSVTRFFTDIISSTLKSRETEGKSRNDMIQLMIEARNSGKASNLSTMDMTAQAFLFLFAGFETAATTMTFAAYEIAVNPDCQGKLRAEIDGVLKTCENHLTWEALQGMHYLEAVVNETLRKYPPVPYTDRVCNKTIDIPPALPGGKPFKVKPGLVLMLPFYGLQQDPRYFPNPEIFDPERFIDPSTGKNLEPLGFIPFGSGPRFCMGQRFGMMEVKLAIFHLLAKCRLGTCERTQIPLTLSKKSYTPTAEHGFWVQISPRH